MTIDIAPVSRLSAGTFNPSLLDPVGRGAPAYLLRQQDRERVSFLLSLIAPDLDEISRWELFEQATNWSLEKLLDPASWQEPRTISARPGREDRWVATRPDLRKALDRASRAIGYGPYLPYFGNGVGGFVIAGLSLGDDGFTSPLEGTPEERMRALRQISGSEIAMRHEELARTSMPVRRYVASSLEAESVSCLVGQERAVVLSPANMIGLGAEDDDVSWWVLTGNFDPLSNRRLRQAVSEGAGAALCKDLKAEGRLERCAGLRQVDEALEGRNEVFFSASDFAAWFGEAGTFISTLFLYRLLDVPKAEDGAIGGTGEAWGSLVKQGVVLPSACPWQRFLTLLLTALHAEARYAPPGDMARKIASSERYLLCGPELTS